MDPELSDILSALGKTGLQSHGAKAPVSGRTRATSEKFDQEFSQLINSIGGGTRSSRSTTLKAEAPLRPPSQSFSKEIEKIIQEFRTLSTKYSLGLSGVVNIEGRLESSKSNYLSQSRIDEVVDEQPEGNSTAEPESEGISEEKEHSEEVPIHITEPIIDQTSGNNPTDIQESPVEVVDLPEKHQETQDEPDDGGKPEVANTEISNNTVEGDEWIVNSSHEFFSTGVNASISTSHEGNGEN